MYTYSHKCELNYMYKVSMSPIFCMSHCSSPNFVQAKIGIVASSITNIIINLISILYISDSANIMDLKESLTPGFFKVFGILLIKELLTFP